MGPRVLVVDDDPHVGELIDLYARREGIAVQSVPDAESALAIIEQDPPDLLVLDLTLPRQDGLELCRRLRARDLEPDGWLPIIMLTARDEEADRVVGLELGADDYVTKPFSPRELIARVKAVLRRSAAQAQRSEGEGRAVIRAGPIEIDRMSRRVVAEGCEVNLTPREFDLLVTLAAHPDRVFTRQGLLDAVWGYDYFGDPRTVDVYIRRLRRKLPPAAAACVETVWGVGYRFVVGKP